MARSLRFILPILFVCLAFPVFAADDKKPAPNDPYAPFRIQLFDGATSFGWKIDGESTVKDGKLILGGAKETTAATTTEFQGGVIDFDVKASKRESNAPPPQLYFGAKSIYKFEADTQLALCPLPDPKYIGPIKFVVPAGQTLAITQIAFLPYEAKPIFNGKDLKGWKVFPGEKYKSVFEVTSEGFLKVSNGPGDLQTDAKYGDFILQLECKTNGKNLNSGLFFRCIDGQYQNGYEAQIQNGFKDDDRTKPADGGTGAIYRRAVARKIVANDNEWFTLTLVAKGSHFATWVNGYQTVDWTDDRKEDENPRKGLRTAAGHLSIQGHDPTTNILFRNIKVLEFAGK